MKGEKQYFNRRGLQAYRKKANVHKKEENIKKNKIIY